MNPALLIAAALAAASPAPADPRVLSVDYDPGRVTLLRGRAHMALQVQFAAGETVEHMALGDAGGWEAATEGSALFLRPRAGARASNLIVTTRGPAGVRHYAFDLALAPAAPFVVRFRYAPTEAEAGRDSVRRALDAPPVPRNRAYSVQGAAALTPAEAFDDGRVTVLRFAPGRPLPVVYEAVTGGGERLAPFDVRGGEVVVHLTARQLRLRRGREVACLYNEAAPSASTSASPTGSAAVTRALRGAP